MAPVGYTGAMPQHMDLRHYIDSLRDEGYTVRDDQGEDPMLIGPDGSAVETWRENYPYDELMSRDDYDVEKYLLQIELLKLQYWVQDTGQRLVVVFEGRDAAGKGGTIKRFIEHLNPRAARVVALDKPTTTEQGQWYFQRYVSHLPTAGEIVLFDRSWYNRAGVERVMGFCTDEEYDVFMKQAPLFEEMLSESGDPRDQAVVLRHPAGAADPVRDPPARPGAPLEALPDGPGEPGQVGGLHRGQGADVPAHRRRRRPLAHDQEQRQEAWPDQRDAALPRLFDYEGKDETVVLPPDPELVKRGRDAVGD